MTAAFMMRTFPSSGGSRRYTIITRSMDTISNPHLQCTTSTPQGAFLAELSNMSHGATCKCILNIIIVCILYRVPIYTPGSRVSYSNVDKVSRWRTIVPGDSGIRTRALMTRVVCTHQYTTAPPQLLLYFQSWCYTLNIHCKNWGVKMTPVGVNRGPHPQV